MKHGSAARMRLRSKLTGAVALLAGGLAIGVAPTGAATMRTGTLAATTTAEPAAFDQGVRLLMVERAGCIYCKRWRTDIMPTYPTSAEGHSAPLARIDIDAPWPDGIALARRPVLTPTFILLRDGQELDRMEGYAGEVFFWALLDRMLSANGITPRQSGR